MRKKVEALAKNVIRGWINVYIDEIKSANGLYTIVFAFVETRSGIVRLCAHTVYDGFNEALEIEICDRMISDMISSLWRR